jgi:hypothetical protein
LDDAPQSLINRPTAPSRARRALTPLLRSSTRRSLRRRTLPRS